MALELFFVDGETLQNVVALFGEEAVRVVEVLEKLETRFRYEKSHEFYGFQTRGCRQLPFEQAFEALFRCPTCNKPMNYVTNNKIIETITRKINQIKKELNE